jgi:hypothetical protein
MSEDSDYEEEVITPVPEDLLQQRQAKKDAFRAKLLEWKSQRIDEITRENQDQTVLNKYLKEASDLYKSIREKLEGRAEFSGGASVPDFDLNALSGMERADLLSAAYSDLVEFPFTYKKELINSLPKKNSLEGAEIIPNQ